MLKIKFIKAKSNLKFSMFSLCSWCLNVDWRSSRLSYCPGNYEVFRQQYGVSKFWRFTCGLYKLSKRISGVSSAMLHLNVSRFESEFDFLPVFTFICKYEINRSLKSIILKQQKNMYKYVNITNYLLQIFCN